MNDDILLIFLILLIIFLLTTREMEAKTEAQVFLERIKPYDEIIEAEAKANTIDPDLIRAIIWQESSGFANVKRYEGPEVGYSYGLMGLTMGAATDMGYKGEEKDLIKPEINVKYGVKYLRYQYDRYKDLDKALTAYNAGHWTGNLTYANAVWKKMKAIKEAKGK